MSGNVGAISNHANQPVDIDNTVTSDCNLYWQLPLSASASNTTTLTVIGQTENPLSPDEVIVAHVPLSHMKESLIFKSNWVAPKDGATVPGSQEYPDVQFNPLELVNFQHLENTLSAEGRFLSVDPAPTVAAPPFTDDSGDNALWTLQAYFMNSEFTFTNTVIGQIPAESVKKVEAGALTSDVLSRTGLPDALVPGSNILSAPYIWAPGAQDSDFALDLFKQADAAGKVRAATVNPLGGAPTSAADASSVRGYSQVDFKLNDSITIYVTYAMTKTKKVSLDDAGENQKFQITTASGVVEFTGGDNNEEVSTATNVTVAYQFVAVADE